MKEIRLTKSTDKVIGALRCSTRVYEKVKEMAVTHKWTVEELQGVLNSAKQSNAFLLYKLYPPEITINPNNK